jgi:hypothetical protein
LDQCSRSFEKSEVTQLIAQTGINQVTQDASILFHHLFVQSWKIPFSEPIDKSNVSEGESNQQGIPFVDSYVMNIQCLGNFFSQKSLSNVEVELERDGKDSTGMQSHQGMMNQMLRCSRRRVEMIKDRFEHRARQSIRREIEEQFIFYADLPSNISPKM